MKDQRSTNTQKGWGSHSSRQRGAPCTGVVAGAAGVNLAEARPIELTPEAEVQYDALMHEITQRKVEAGTPIGYTEWRAYSDPIQEAAKAEYEARCERAAAYGQT